MKDSDEPTLPGGPGYEDIKRNISGTQPDNMGILDLLLIDAWLSQEMRSFPNTSQRVCDLKKLKTELVERLQHLQDEPG